MDDVSSIFVMYTKRSVTGQAINSEYGNRQRQYSGFFPKVYRTSNAAFSPSGS